MIILIGGSTHTGKTFLAQNLLEKYHYPYLSLDHLKMGLIRSGQTSLTPMDGELLTEYMWPIVREMIKTAIENDQNLIIEGCYIPYDWKKDFDDEYLHEIHTVFLIMSKAYIENHFQDILKHGSVVENRGDDDCQIEELIHDNEVCLKECQKNNCEYILIDKEYKVNYTV